MRHGRRHRNVPKHSASGCAPLQMDSCTCPSAGWCKYVSFMHHRIIESQYWINSIKINLVKKKTQCNPFPNSPHNLGKGTQIITDWMEYACHVFCCFLGLLGSDASRCFPVRPAVCLPKRICHIGCNIPSARLANPTSKGINMIRGRNVKVQKSDPKNVHCISLCCVGPFSRRPSSRIRPPP